MLSISHLLLKQLPSRKIAIKLFKDIEFHALKPTFTKSNPFPTIIRNAMLSHDGAVFLVLLPCLAPQAEDQRV